MTNEEIYNRLSEVFRDIFDDDTITVTPETSSNDIEEWDNLHHISLLSAVEDEFGIRFTMAQTVGMKNVGEMAYIIKNNG